MKFEKFFTKEELKGMYGPKSIQTPDQIRRLDEFQESITDARHIARVNKLIPEAEAHAVGHGGAAIKDLEREVSTRFIRKMNELTIKAGLRVPWTAAVPPEKKKRAVYAKRDEMYLAQRRLAMGLQAEGREA